MVIWYEECERCCMNVKRYQTSLTVSICAAKVGFQDSVALHPVTPLHCTYIKAGGSLLYSEDIKSRSHYRLSSWHNARSHKKHGQ